MKRLVWLLVCAVGLVASPACKPEGAPAEQKLILEQHAPRIASLMLETIARHERGLSYAADRIAPGFVRVSGAQQETEMRQVLKLLRSPKRGVPELVISPMSFMAVVGPDGKCLARDAEPDKMKGLDLAKMFPTVAGALAGHQGMEIGEFVVPDAAAKEKLSDTRITIVMAAPAHYQGQIVGALVLGIPLWRLQQQFTKQLQMELAGKKPVVIWVYVYRGEELHHWGTPDSLDQLVPNAAVRKAGLAKSPGGFTGSVQQFGYTYAYGVRPLRVLGPDIGVVIFRMQDQS